MFKHYLTRGWDWANQLPTGSQTQSRLNADIDAGKVFQLYTVADGSPALTIAPLVQLAQASWSDVWDAPVLTGDSRPAPSLAPVSPIADAGAARNERSGQTDVSFLAAR